MKKHVVVTLALSVLMSGCSTFRNVIPVELKDGRQGYVINCSNDARGWGLCLDTAKKVCESSDYDIVTKVGEGLYVNGNLRSMPWDVITPRSMTISCENLDKDAG